MTASAFIKNPTVRRTAWRAMWAVFLVGHMPAVIGAISNGEAGFIRVAVLVLSQIFFALKVLDVAWLRVANDRRTITALVTGFVLLHARVVVFSATHTLDSPNAWQVVVVTAGLAGAAVVVARRKRQIDQVRSRAHRRQTRRLVDLVLDAISVALLPPRFERLAQACTINRAPPVCAGAV